MAIQQLGSIFTDPVASHKQSDRLSILPALIMDDGKQDPQLEVLEFASHAASSGSTAVRSVFACVSMNQR